MSKLNNTQLPDTLSSKTIDNTNDINTNLTQLSISGGTGGQVLSTNGSGVLSWITASSGGLYQVDTFTSSGTWTKPTGAKYIELWMISAGNGGGSGRRGDTSTNRCGGAGGGGNTWACFKINSTEIDSTLSVTIGAGGIGGASITTDNTNGNPGAYGGNTYAETFSPSYKRYQTKPNYSFSEGGGEAEFSQPGIITGNGFPWGSYYSQDQISKVTHSFPLGSGKAGNGTFSYISFGNQSGNFGTSNPMGGGGGGAPAGVENAGTGGTSYVDLPHFGQINASGGTIFNGRNGENAKTANSWNLIIATGGGGGMHTVTNDGGNGGNGAFGSGGGGGGASNNGFNSGAGGNGGNGCVIIITYG